MLDTLLNSLALEWIGAPASREPVQLQTQNEMSSIPASEALIETVGRALRNSGYSALGDLEVEYSAGTIVLWGRVPTYHLKQLAQVVTQKVDGVRRVANGVEVNCVRSRLGRTGDDVERMRSNAAGAIRRSLCLNPSLD